MALLTAVATASVGCVRVHPQQPERKVYVISEDASGVGSEVESGTGGAGVDAYCNEIQKQCFNKCWRRKPEYPGIEKHSGDHYKLCSEKCLKVFMQCVKEQEELERQDSRKTELHFQTMGVALDWLREHKTEVALGTVVVVGGVIAAPYVIVIMGGALVLAPL
jgi:N-acetylneuraminic acid mutarotase